LAALRNTADADDVAQDALVLAFQRIDQFRGDASVRTWMVTIAWRLALSRRRSPWHRLKHLVVSTNTPEVDRIKSAQPSAERRLLHAEQVEIARDEIKRLPSTLRDAFLLAGTGDLTLDEIAAALRVPAGTLRWRVMEARRRLQRKLEH
jgi:RNA polymerase sigma-70 factor (ECF subfamily)